MQRRDFLTEGGRVLMGACLLPLAGCERHTDAPPGEPPARWRSLLADLEARIPSLLDRAVVPAVSMALVDNGALIWRRAVGVKDAASRDPVDVDTVFEAGSVSKTVFAYAVMKLCERGVLDLDTPLRTYAPPPFLEEDERINLITARHVLSHTSGLPNFRSGDDATGVRFIPGERFLYSGEGYFYLQSVMTRLTGREDLQSCATFEGDLRVCATDFDEYMRRNLLIPFGMHSSGYEWSDVFERAAASPHDAEGRPSRRSPRAPDVARYGALGGLLTTPTDYARFLIELVDPKPPDAYRLSGASLAEMLRPQIRVSGTSSWALGWQVNPTEKGNVIAHSGHNPGFVAFAAASVVRKTGLIIMTNRDPNGGEVITELLRGERMQEFLAVGS